MQTPLTVQYKEKLFICAVCTDIFVTNRILPGIHIQIACCIACIACIARNARNARIIHNARKAINGPYYLFCPYYLY